MRNFRVGGEEDSGHGKEIKFREWFWFFCRNKRTKSNLSVVYECTDIVGTRGRESSMFAKTGIERKTGFHGQMHKTAVPGHLHKMQPRHLGLATDIYRLPVGPELILKII